MDIWGLSRLIQDYGLGRRNKITAVQVSWSANSTHSSCALSFLELLNNGITIFNCQTIYSNVSMMSNVRCTLNDD